MKKSYNKNINLEDLIKEAEKMAGFKTDVNASDLMDDSNKIFSFVDKFENLDYENLNSINLDSLQKEVKDIENNLRNKYKDYLPKEEQPKEEKKESKEDLDTEE